jgi:hypothetical protein
MSIEVFFPTEVGQPRAPAKHAALRDASREELLEEIRSLGPICVLGGGIDGFCASGRFVEYRLTRRHEPHHGFISSGAGELAHAPRRVLELFVQEGREKGSQSSSEWLRTARCVAWYWQRDRDPASRELLSEVGRDADVRGRVQGAREMLSHCEEPFFIPVADVAGAGYFLRPRPGMDAQIVPARGLHARMLEAMPREHFDAIAHALCARNSHIEWQSWLWSGESARDALDDPLDRAVADQVLEAMRTSLVKKVREAERFSRLFWRERELSLRRERNMRIFWELHKAGPGFALVTLGPGSPQAVFHDRGRIAFQGAADCEPLSAVAAEHLPLVHDALREAHADAHAHVQKACSALESMRGNARRFAARIVAAMETQAALAAARAPRAR